MSLGSFYLSQWMDQSLDTFLRDQSESCAYAVISIPNLDALSGSTKSAK